MFGDIKFRNFLLYQLLKITVVNPNIRLILKCLLQALNSLYILYIHIG